MPPSSARLARIHLITIPSSDPARSIAFYERLGFETRADRPFGTGHRWVELFPPDGTAGIALAPASGENAGVATGIILTSEDLDATHAALRADGVDVDAAIAGAGAPDVHISIGEADLVEPEPRMFQLRDPDGNQLLVVG